MNVKCKNCKKEYELDASEFCCKACVEEYFMH
jgi:Zn finger protein HypA/HybF involved in hydrogenase expression